MNWPEHGSNPQYIYKEMKISKPKNLIDFSANINPFGPPGILKEKWSELYPEIYDYPDPHTLILKERIAERENVDRSSILIGNGGSEIISLIGRMLAGKNVLLIEPAFSEYEKACNKNGCQIFYHHLKEPEWELDEKEIALKLKGMDAVFLCNPNNPTGIRYPHSTIVKLLKECKQNNSYLIIDEAFYDFLEDYIPIAPLLKDYSNLIILRSMTKMYAIPGLRLGYVLAGKHIIEKLSDDQPHWSVNILAMSAGELCLQDDRFIDNTINFIHTERERLFSFFHREAFVVSESSINFYLLRDPLEKEQMPFFEFLLRRGIVPRHTYNFPGLEGKWLRFAIKGTKENNRLMEVLTEWRQLP
ncbi:threonine-phosphate decarboxylase [Virgibacillus profundi]|uniref:threonine-phosphate decarboxylase n=1 Tax=Virgibacillus profundi TaxID=2024555 RepID=A0A2A2IA41_9BACI|nr:threonine-phosphate decarboxylase CobD [Virgibacillus profundi]PAV27990.1 threonine-phosphate decarboxylase [Virgibacillus profundi]PXY52168.1 threonine-phosphate decarboxylase [Virgibacillus profundi]